MCVNGKSKMKVRNFQLIFEGCILVLKGPIGFPMVVYWFRCCPIPTHHLSKKHIPEEKKPAELFPLMENRMMIYGHRVWKHKQANMVSDILTHFILQ
jgi:hypothetical protein